MRAPACMLFTIDVGKKRDQDRWLRHLLEPRHFEEWRERCFHSPLCLRAELFEAFPTKWAVFELATVSLLGEPFSAVPTFHYCCNTHFSSFTSCLLIPFPSLLDEIEENCSDYHYSLLTCYQ